MTPDLSIVIPFRDEAGCLGALYRELDEVVAGLGLSAEMIFVDDASRDGGELEIVEAAQADPRVRLLSLSPHSGQSAALEAGFRAARAELVATLDADGQNDPADLERLLEALPGADCVNGIRMQRHDSRSRRWASRIANRVRRRVLGDDVSDIGCSLRVMRSVFLRRIQMRRGLHRFLPVLLAIEGARIVEVPVQHRARRAGASKYGIGQRLRVVLPDLLAVAWMRRRALRYEAKELSRRA